MLSASTKSNAAYVARSGKKTQTGRCAVTMHKTNGRNNVLTLLHNVELTGAEAASSPERPATEGSEVERRVVRQKVAE